MSAKFKRTATPGVYRKGSRYVVCFRRKGRQHKRSCMTYEAARRLKADLTDGLYESGQGPATEEMREWREANRIIAAWGPEATPVEPIDRQLHAGPPPGCKATRQDGYACWRDPGGYDTCRPHEEPLNIEGARQASRFVGLMSASESVRAGVYFLVGQGTDLVRIGRAVDVDARLKEHQASSPVELTLHRFVPTLYLVALETALHRRFRMARARPERRRDEWFHASQVLPLIDELSDAEIRMMAWEGFPSVPRLALCGDLESLAQWFGQEAGGEVLSLVWEHPDAIRVIVRPAL